MTSDWLERVAEVRGRVAAAARAAGRPPEEVTIVAAAKGQPPEAVAAVLAAGLTDIGHNYVQEAATCRALVAAPAHWRMIGPLQRNKAGAAARLFDAVDTIADARLAEALARRAAEAGRPPVEVLIQVRLGGEDSKSGIEPEQAERLLEALQQIGHLRCLGWMTMPPPAPPARARSWFAELRRLAEAMRAQSGLPLPVLSMGMSGDYEAAIAEGATHVRIGTALFGPRRSTSPSAVGWPTARGGRTDGPDAR